METKFYKGRKAFIEGIAEKSGDKIDINQSLFLPLFGFVTKDGKQCPSSNAMAFVQQYNSLFGDIIDVNSTRTVGSVHSFMVGYKVTEDQVPEDKVVLETGSTKLVFEPEGSVEITTSTKAEYPTPDFDYAESLSEDKSKSEAKIALEEYARQFNVELSRSKKFSSMIKDFKQAL